jgi:hypothetical protein
MIGGTVTSPYVYQAIDINGATIGFSVPFDLGTGAILDGTQAHRDSGCLFTQVSIGKSAGGAENAPIKINLSGFVGVRTFTAAQLASQGLTNISDVKGTQITAV